MKPSREMNPPLRRPIGQPRFRDGREDRYFQSPVELPGREVALILWPDGGKKVLVWITRH
jgi:hypothetical protein